MIAQLTPVAACLAPLLMSGTALAQLPDSDPYYQEIGARKTKTLPPVIIRNMIEDRAGHVWFATFGGPLRYDGEDFTNFEAEVGLAKMRTFAVLEDRAGALWFGSVIAGVSRFDGKTATRFTVADGLANDTVAALCEDRDGRI